MHDRHVTVDDVPDMAKEENASRLARFGGTTGDAGSALDILATPLHHMFSVRGLLAGAADPLWHHHPLWPHRKNCCHMPWCRQPSLHPLWTWAATWATCPSRWSSAPWRRAIFPPAGVTCCTSSGGKTTRGGADGTGGSAGVLACFALASTLLGQLME